MVEKIYCPSCKSERELIRIIHGNPLEGLQKLADDGKIILRGKVTNCSDPLYACSVCKTGFPEYGTFGDWYQAMKNKALKIFISKEEDLVGTSYIKPILKRAGKI